MVRGSTMNTSLRRRNLQQAQVGPVAVLGDKLGIHTYEVSRFNGSDELREVVDSAYKPIIHALSSMGYNVSTGSMSRWVMECP